MRNTICTGYAWFCKRTMKKMKNEKHNLYRLCMVLQTNHQPETTETYYGHTSLPWLMPWYSSSSRDHRRPRAEDIEDWSRETARARTGMCTTQYHGTSVRTYTCTIGTYVPWTMMSAMVHVSRARRAGAQPGRPPVEPAGADDH